MKKNDISIEEFKRYIGRVKCVSLFHYKLISDIKLKEIGRVEREEFETSDDISSLAADNLVWYKNEKNERVYWNNENAVNISVDEQAMAYRNNEPMDEKMSWFVNTMKDGLTHSVEIVSVYDTVLKQTVIVDGVYRAVALYYLYLTSKDYIERMLSSEHKISRINLISPAASMLFPCDFLNICRDSWK